MTQFSKGSGKTIKALQERKYPTAAQKNKQE
jgi:hypothetical protein